jgi:(3,5-dihydroxyphenyl)acetyl-CoA 1,2-dioxygenase
MQSRALTLSECAQRLIAAGFAAADAGRWVEAWPEEASHLRADKPRYANFWRMTAGLLARLPAKPQRVDTERMLADSIIGFAREARERFLRAHAAGVYDALTGGRSQSCRLDELCYAAAEAFPGLVPTRDEVKAESRLAQRDKQGVEIDQGLLLAHILANEAAGRHLVHAMLRPRKDSLAMAPQFARTGVAELAGVRLERRGKAACLTMRNPRFLNAEDASTLDGFETAVDLALLDPASEVCVLRGDGVEHRKYAGRRVFGAGINLTRLYQGKIPFLWYLLRDLGFVNKLYRGLAGDWIDELAGDTREKLWIAAVDTFAIGGHCQILLAVDYTLAASDAYLSLPARKEGIIPGAANLRLPRFVGDRLARQAIFYERRFECDSAEGRMLCDRIVAPEQMDEAIDETVERLTSSGVVSAAANRRALRVAQEPLDMFRTYMAAYAREQAQCHFSPALIANLERHWDARNRTA